jgi:hypothetical protein
MNIKDLSFLFIVEFSNKTTTKKLLVKGFELMDIKDLFLFLLLIYL